jgi:ADP-heptose:LPS heptosyltransferase
MMFPLLDALRNENPNLEISFFTQGTGRLIGVHSAIDHLHVIEAPPSNTFWAKVPPLARILAWWWKHWRHLRFHTVVVLRGGVDPYRSHHLAWLLGGTRRIAYSPKLEPELPAYQYDVSPLFTDEVEEMQGIHEVTRGNEVLNLAGLLKGTISIEEPVASLLGIAESTAARNYRHQIGLEDQSYAVVALGASIERRAWPVAAFAELARKQLLNQNMRIVLVGGPELAPAALKFRELAGENVLDLTGSTNFEQLIAVCGKAICFVGNDSGPAHIAGACGVPTLIITAFAQSSRTSHHASPVRSHPLGPFVAVVQPKEQLSGCETQCIATEPHCILEVTVEETSLALQELLASAIRISKDCPE